MYLHFTLAIFFCLLGGKLANCRNISSVCISEVAGNILWSSMNINAGYPCEDVHPKLQGGFVRRTCLNGRWLTIDFSQCTLTNEDVFLLLWLPLATKETTVLNNTALILLDIAGLNSALTGVNISLAATQSIGNSYTSTLILLTFPQQSGVPSPEDMQTLESDLLQLRERFDVGGAALLNSSGTKLGYRGFYRADACSCQQNSSLFQGHCARNAPTSPCVCSGKNLTCQCAVPEYVGDGTRCTPDRDIDSFPDVALDSCNDQTTRNNFCTPDNCPLIHNPTQDITACVAPSNFDGCLSERGARLNILWGNTRRGDVDRQRCPDAQGFATRTCTKMGWSPVDLSMCTSQEFDSAFIMAEEIFDDGATNKSLRDRLIQVSSITNEIVTLTASNTFSLLPSDLNSTNQVLSGVILLLEDTLTSDEDTSGVSNSDVLSIFSNVLDGANLNGWLELTEMGEGTPRLLDNVERYALYQARTVNDTDPERRLWKRDNIIISFHGVPSDTTTPVMFPESLDDLSGVIGFDFIPAQVELPALLFQSRRGNMRTRVPSSSFLVRNMEMAMPTDTEDDTSTSENDNSSSVSIASMVISSQVDERGMRAPELIANPVKLMFQFDKEQNISASGDGSDNENIRYRCAYWKFSNPIGNGHWAFDGVKMTSIEERDGKMIVNCSAIHLTSFAVLVDVSGVLSGPEVSELETKALAIVSYVGCAISVFFLLITIIFFLAQGRDLFVKVHYFIHLNLAITLFLAYLIFIAVGEKAAEIEEVCITVAVVLHYLFLSSFCWMLGEGIMLYLMLVVVFSKLSKNVWFFILLGYALPVVPVVISVGVRYDNYGITNQEGNLTFCWLSTEDGLIWAFTGPMLAIIMVNCVFLVMALVKVYKTRKSSRSRSTIKKRYERGKKDKKDDGTSFSDRFDLFKTLIMGVAVLLPMLGITWVFGLFAVNRQTTFFAWLFAIINSLQGFFIFFFHVVRSDKVWKNPNAMRLRSNFSSRIKSSTKSSSTGGSIISSSDGGRFTKTASKSVLLGDMSSQQSCVENGEKTEEIQTEEKV